MDGYKRWQNYSNNDTNYSNQGARGRAFNNRDAPRPNFNQSNVNRNFSQHDFNDTSRRQNNPSRDSFFSSQNTTAHSSFGGRDNRNQSYSRYSRNKSFPQTRPSPYGNNPNRYGKRGRGNNSHAGTSVQKVLTPLEAKVERLIGTVRAQNGAKGQLVLLQSEIENPTVVLQNAVQSLRNGVLTVTANPLKGIFTLSINGESFADGTFESKQVAKNAMCERVLNDLKKYCFFIIKKKNYEEVSTDDITKTKKEVQPENKMEGSKAHLMMLKMGWGGKGLGSKEQGEEKTVAETITQNITKEGLGGKNVMGEVDNILQEFASSTKVTTLAFDSGFTKEERAHIHQIAGKYNLKSKSEGSGENRRITISKKLGRWDLVKELLLDNCENDSYKLTIPSEYENIWLNG